MSSNGLDSEAQCILGNLSHRVEEMKRVMRTAKVWVCEIVLGLT